MLLGSTLLEMLWLLARCPCMDLGVEVVPGYQAVGDRRVWYPYMMRRSRDMLDYLVTGADRSRGTWGLLFACLDPLPTVHAGYDVPGLESWDRAGRHRGGDARPCCAGTPRRRCRHPCRGSRESQPPTSHEVP